MSQLTDRIEKIKDNESKFSKELSEIIEILDAIESHTAELRKKILNEVSSNKNNLHLKLDKIEE